jgi:hypothetical protein
MDNPKTIKDVMQGIDSLTRSVEWSEDNRQSIVYFIFDGENVMSNILGHSSCAAVSIVTAMISDNDFRDVVLTAYKAYINHIASELAPICDPLIKHIDKVKKDMMGNQDAELAPCVMSAKFTPHKS